MFQALQKVRNEFWICSELLQLYPLLNIHLMFLLRKQAKILVFLLQFALLKSLFSCEKKSHYLRKHLIFFSSIYSQLSTVAVATLKDVCKTFLVLRFLPVWQLSVHIGAVLVWMFWGENEIIIIKVFSCSCWTLILLKRCWEFGTNPGVSPHRCHLRAASVPRWEASAASAASATIAVSCFLAQRPECHSSARDQPCGSGRREAAAKARLSLGTGRRPRGRTGDGRGDGGREGSPPPLLLALQSGGQLSVTAGGAQQW